MIMSSGHVFLILRATCISRLDFDVSCTLSRYGVLAFFIAAYHGIIFFVSLSLILCYVAGREFETNRVFDWQIN